MARGVYVSCNHSSDLHAPAVSRYVLQHVRELDRQAFGHEALRLGGGRRMRSPAWAYWVASLTVGVVGFALAVFVATNP